MVDIDKILKDNNIRFYRVNSPMICINSYGEPTTKEAFSTIRVTFNTNSSIENIIDYIIKQFKHCIVYIYGEFIPEAYGQWKFRYAYLDPYDNNTYDNVLVPKI